MKFYEGPSEITSDIIMGYVGAYKRPSRNTKTGKMVQVGVMAKAERPNVAQETGLDRSVCDNCSMRPLIHGNGVATKETIDGKKSCYVNTGWKASQYDMLQKQDVTYDDAVSIIKDSKFPIRFGDYGNMSAIPREVIEPILKLTNGRHTMYDWRWAKAPWLKHYAQASVMTKDHARTAQAMGFKTFRQGTERMKGEAWCLYYKNGTQCADCLLCNGKQNIVIPNH